MAQVEARAASSQRAYQASGARSYYYGGTTVLRALSQHPSLLGKFYAGLLGEVGRAFMENGSKAP